MKKWTTLLFVIVLFVAQFSILGTLLKKGWSPNLFLAFAVCLVVLFGFEKAWAWIVFCGLMMDVGSTWPIGSGTLVIVTIAWLIDKLKVVAELRSKRYLFVILLSLFFAVSSLIFDIILQILSIFEKQLGLTGSTLPEINLNSAYIAKIILSVIFGMAIYFFARKIKLAESMNILIRR